ncbi:MAG: hypothetical protein HYZ34_04575 [Ignavibacteriae bacterium]|nr:hypothetical protein [Ignavibacteriota bacterium]
MLKEQGETQAYSQKMIVVIFLSLRFPEYKVHVAEYRKVSLRGAKRRSNLAFRSTFDSEIASLRSQ